MRRKIITLFMCVVLLLCTACGGRSDEVRVSDETFGATLSGDDGSRLFARQSVPMPELGLYAEMAEPVGEDKIVIMCRSGQERRFFSMDASTFQVEALEIQCDSNIIDIDSMVDGSFSILSINAEGEYVISTVLPEHDVEQKNKLNVEQLILPKDWEEYSFWDICVCENGYLLNQGASVIAVDKTGKQLSSFGPYRGGVSFLHGPDGNAIIASYVAGETGATVQVLDSSFNVRETYELKNSYTSFFDGEDERLFAFNSDVIYSLDYVNDTRTGYCNTFASGGGANNFIYLSQDCFFSIQKGVPTIWTPSSADGITMMTLATYGMSPDLRSAVNGFNELSTEYKIDVVDYATYDEAENSTLGLNLLRTDIISGDTPDIYDLNMLPARQFAERGLFQDFRPFLEADSKIMYEDLLPGAAKAMESDGKLYYLIPSFYINTMYGNGEIVGYEADWGMDDFIALAEQHSACELLGNNMTRNEFIQLLLIYNGEQYIDYENGTCDFLNQGFIRLLQLTAELPSDPLTPDDAKWASAYFDEQILVADQFRDGIPDIAVADGIFRGYTSYVGFPTDNKTGVRISPVLQLAMSSSTMVQDGVWAFFSYLLSDEFQAASFGESRTEGVAMMSGLSSMKGIFDKQADRWLKTLGKYQFCLSTVYGGSPFDIPAAPADDKLRENAVSLMDRVNGLYELDSDVYTIVIEEAAAFFNGDRSVEETAEHIQSRASIYISEQYG